MGTRLKASLLVSTMVLFGVSVWGQTQDGANAQLGHSASATAENHANPIELAAAGPAPLASPEPINVAAPIELAPVIINKKPEQEKPSNDSRNKKIWYSLTVVNHSAAAFDAWSTRNSIQHGARELNPLLKPFASSNAMYVANQVVPFGMDYLGRRMMHSDNRIIRKLWWLPQTASAACSLAAGIHNMGVNP